MFDQRLCSLPDNDGGADDGNKCNGCNGDYAGITGVGSLGRLNRKMCIRDRRTTGSAA